MCVTKLWSSCQVYYFDPWSMGNLGQRVQQYALRTVERKDLSKMLVSYYFTPSSSSWRVTQVQSRSCLCAWPGWSTTGSISEYKTLALDICLQQILNCWEAKGGVSACETATIICSSTGGEMCWLKHRTELEVWQLRNCCKRHGALGRNKMLSESAFDLPLACLFQRQRENCMHSF